METRKNASNCFPRIKEQIKSNNKTHQINSLPAMNPYQTKKQRLFQPVSALQFILFKVSHAKNKRLN